MLIRIDKLPAPVAREEFTTSDECYADDLAVGKCQVFVVILVSQCTDLFGHVVSGGFRQGQSWCAPRAQRWQVNLALFSLPLNRPPVKPGFFQQAESHVLIGGGQAFIPDGAPPTLGMKRDLAARALL